MTRWFWPLFAVRLAQAAPWTEENGPWNLNFETKHEPHLYYGQWPGHTYNPSPSDWRSLVIYQLLTDRFADGNPLNNELYAAGFDVRDMTFRHGGDFEGLRQKLHYIKGLGCNGVWISPIFQNGDNFYHQYAQLDFTVLDRRLGTLEDLRNLVQEAHSLNMYVIVDIVMNHMANEFYFEGHAKSQAPWRFHEDEGKREYQLKVRTTQATFFNSSIWCGGEPLWQEFGNEPTGLLQSSDVCEANCTADPDCYYFLWKNDPGSLSTYHCAGFKYCDQPTPYTDGKGSIFKTWQWAVKAEEVAVGVWCGGSGLFQQFGNEATGLLASRDVCEAECAADAACEFYLWKDDTAADTRFHCAGFASCAEADRSAFGDGFVKIFKKRTTQERSLDGLYDTPAGRQPYADFWYNNTWVPDAQYNGTLYGQWGESVVDPGFGTYIGSDFHHNGDLINYYDPWEINMGKIYGVMDDLRLENERVQQKYIAMTKLLIDSTDIDGYRVDTPMQVPLNFYKVWAPAIRAHAKTLGKDRFGIFGEFFVSPQRYGTMTGRGRDNTMYNQEIYIDDIATLKGGIVYPYYWYIFTAMIYKLPEYADGLPLAYREENKIIDTYDPTTGRHEYAMWTFCNNHDNWRLQSMTGFPEFRMCLAVITFWPGVPLHYAGDEQDFDTPGSALDGWAREELSPSLAWRAVRTQPGGNPADKDSFDMTSATYQYIRRLNALRTAYLGGFGEEECDQIQTPSYATPDVLVFIRGCTSEKVLMFANFHTSEQRTASIDAVPWADATVLTDCISKTAPAQVTVNSGSVSFVLSPLQAVAFAAAVAKVPPAVVEVWPAHGAAVPIGSSQLTLKIKFDRPMAPSISTQVLFDQSSSGFQCAENECTKQVDASALSDGHHFLEVAEGAVAEDGTAMHATFRSTFIFDRQGGVIADPTINELPGLICSGGSKLCHKASGATWFRVQNVGGNWSEWMPYNGSSTTWSSQFDVPVLVQYFSDLSASFIVGDCLTEAGKRCYVSWHKQMFVRGEFNNWGNDDEGTMSLIGAYTWATNVTLDGFVRARFTPVTDWSKSYGMHPVRELLYNVPTFDPRHTNFDVVPTLSGSEPCRQWMVDRDHWSEHHTVASGAEFAVDLWLSHECTVASPTCVPDADADWQCHGYKDGQDGPWCASVGTENCYDYAVNDQTEAMSGCGGCYCCRRKVTTAATGPAATCCVKFNDLFLNYTVTSDLSQCAPHPGTSHASFTMSIQVADASDLQAVSASFAAAVAASLSVTADVTVSVSYIVAANYVLSDVSDLEAAKTEICNAFSDADACVAELGSRRLQGSESATLHVEVTTLDASRFATTLALANDGAAMQSALRSSQVGSNTVLNMPSSASSEMRVLTDVTSGSIVAPSNLVPETARLESELSSIHGANVEFLSVAQVTTTTPTQATTTTQAGSTAAATQATTTAQAGSTAAATTSGSASGPVTLRVRSAGSDDGNFAEFYLNGVKVDLESGRGISVVVLDGGSVSEKHVYDTGYQALGAGPLSALLNGLPLGTVVLVASMDDASDGLTTEAKAAIAGLGATQVESISYRGSYALIGVKGGDAIAEAVAVTGLGPVTLEETVVFPLGFVSSSSSQSTEGASSSQSTTGFTNPVSTSVPASTSSGENSQPPFWTFEFADGSVGLQSLFALLIPCMAML